MGLTSDQVRELRGLFDTLDITCRVLVLQGAGQRAGCADASYIEAGAEIITRDELECLDGAPDVVHALKEPSVYERHIPGPFLRIGAVHTGDFMLKAPMPGLVIDVPVAEGQAVKKGDVLVILESMKMQNEFKAPLDGIVQRIKVKPGQTVEQHVLMLTVVVSGSNEE